MDHLSNKLFEEVDRVVLTKGISGRHYLALESEHSEQRLIHLRNKIRSLIDTNVLIKTINRFFIYEYFQAEKFQWVVSTSILDECEEKLTEFYSRKTAFLVLEILCNASNVIFDEPHFHWQLIDVDPDDNTFSDLAISVNADCLVTFDKHFDIFKTLSFPRLSVIKPSEFLEFFSAK